jgi:hypothetical protein
MGLYCHGCHNWRNKFKAVVKNRLTDNELELEMIKAHNILIETGKVVEVKREKIIGYLCKKCSIKAVTSVKERPFGMGWRQAFNLRNNPEAIQAWKDQRLEMEIAKNG